MNFAGRIIQVIVVPSIPWNSSQFVAHNNYLELLLAMDKEVVQQCLAELQTERLYQFSTMVDRGE